MGRGARQSEDLLSAEAIGSAAELKSKRESIVARARTIGDSRLNSKQALIQETEELNALLSETKQLIKAAEEQKSRAGVLRRRGLGREIGKLETLEPGLKEISSRQDRRLQDPGRAGLVPPLGVSHWFPRDIAELRKKTRQIASLAAGAEKMDHESCNDLFWQTRNLMKKVLQEMRGASKLRKRQLAREHAKLSRLLFRLHLANKDKLLASYSEYREGVDKDY